MNSKENKQFAEGGIVTPSDFDPFGIHEIREKGEYIVPSESARINVSLEKMIEFQRTVNKLSKSIKDALQSERPNKKR